MLALTGCVSYGDSFFIRNHESNPVTVSYRYFQNNGILDAPDRPASRNAWVSDSLLPLKFLKKVPYYETLKSFDSVPALPDANGWITLKLPARSSAYIQPMFNYGENIQSLVINGADTIRFTKDYPVVEREDLKWEKLVRIKNFGYSYRLVELKIKEIQAILNAE